MLKFSSKSDVNAECKCIVRLLDDSEVIECDIQVTNKKRIYYDANITRLCGFSRSNYRSNESIVFNKRETPSNPVNVLFVCVCARDCLFE